MVEYDKWRCECKKCNVCAKYYVWNLAKCACGNQKCLASIMNQKTVSINFNEL